MRTSTKLSVIAAILLGFAFNSIPKNNNLADFSNTDAVEISSFCPGSGAKCFSVL